MPNRNSTSIIQALVRGEQSPAQLPRQAQYEYERDRDLVQTFNAIDAMWPNYQPGTRESTNVEDRRNDPMPLSLRARVLFDRMVRELMIPKE